MQGIFKGPERGFKLTLAGSFLLHLIVISLALIFFNTEKRVFFSPVYTVNLVAKGPSSTQAKKTEAVKPEAAPPEHPVKKEAAKIKEPEKVLKELPKVKEPVKVKEAPKPKPALKTVKPDPVSVDEAVKKIAADVKKKDESSVLDSAIEGLRKKKEAESKQLASRIDELKKELDRGEEKRSQKPQPQAAPPQARPAQPASSPGVISKGGVSRENLEARYPAYFSVIHDRVQEQWMIYTEDLKNSSLSLIVSVKIDRTGKLLDSSIEKSSGDPRFDESLLKAIKKAVFPPLPENFEGSFLETGFRFCPGCTN